jgi:hypothetical protein
MMRKAAPSLALILILCGICLCTCGIEDYIYLSQIPEANITWPNDREVELKLPVMPGSYFSNYTIYYRIYLSSQLVAGKISSASFSTINSTLFSDYSSFEQYTQPDSTISVTNIASQFQGRSYFPLTASTIYSGNDSINDDMLSNSGQNLFIDFSQNLYPGFDAPVLVRGAMVKYMLRSNNNGTFVIIPTGDPRFLASTELRETTPSSTVNSDIVRASTAGTPAYAYVALYILAAGIDDDLSPIYSRPTFIGVFKLD